MSYQQLVIDATSPEDQIIDEESVRKILVGTFGDAETVKQTIDAIVARLEESNPTVMLKTLVLLHRTLRDGSQPLLSSAINSTTELLSGDVVPHHTLYDTLANPDSVPSHWSDAALLTKYRGYLTVRLKAIVQLRSEDAVKEENVDASVGHFRRLPVADLFKEMPKLQEQLTTLLECQRESCHAGSESLIGLDREMVAKGFALMMKDAFSLHRSASEGIVNLLELFFTLDRANALIGVELYKTFMSQTDTVIGMHTAALNLPAAISGPYPDIQPAPSSLLSALEEYINQISSDDEKILLTDTGDQPSTGAFAGIATSGTGKGSFALSNHQLDQVLVKIEKMERAIAEGRQATLQEKAKVQHEELEKQATSLQEVVAERQKTLDGLKGSGGFFGFGGKKKDASEEERVKAAETQLASAQQELSAALSKKEEAGAGVMQRLHESSEERVAAEVKELKELVVQVAANANDMVATLQLKLEALEAAAQADA